jgi:hypothetical protein
MTRLVLSAFISLFSYLVYAGQETCLSPLVKVETIAAIKRRIRDTCGVLVFSDHSMGGGYSSETRTIYSDSSQPLEMQKLILQHEAVHMTTDKKFLTNPTAENAAPAIEIRRLGAAIDPKLGRYSGKYRLDEGKAYFKEFLQIKQMARPWKESGRDDSRVLEAATRYKETAHTFAQNSLHILKGLRSVLNEVVQGKKTTEIETTSYTSFTPDHYLVQMKLEQMDGPPILVSLPVFAPEARKSGGEIPRLFSKLLEVCDAGIRQSEKLLANLDFP